MAHDVGIGARRHFRLNIEEKCPALSLTWGVLLCRKFLHSYKFPIVSSMWLISHVLLNALVFGSHEEISNRQFDLK